MNERFPEPGSEGVSEGWNALVAGALDSDDVGGLLGDVIRLFGGLGFAERLQDPAAARDQCISVSGTFADVCNHRGIPAESVTGFLFARVPPFEQELVVDGHTAVQVQMTAGRGGELVIDWTARQYDPGVPVPLIVTAAAWRAFWRNPGKPAGGRDGGPASAPSPAALDCPAAPLLPATRTAARAGKRASNPSRPQARPTPGHR